MELLIAGLAPAAFWMVGFWWWDRHDREPLNWVIGMFLLGATVVFFLGGFLNEFVAALIGLDLNDVSTATLVLVVLIAPVVEEMTKWGTGRIALRKTAVLNEPVDAMVFGTAVGLGFAGAENALYLILGAQALAEIPLACVGLTLSNCAIVNVLPLRAIGTTLMHGLAGGLAGHSIAKARLGTGIPNSAVPGLLLAILVHAVWNFFSIMSVLIAFAVLALAAWGYARLFRDHLRVSPHAAARPAVAGQTRPPV